MDPRTGAERYFADRMKDPDYARAHEQARARIDFIDRLLGALDEERQQKNLTKAELARRAGLRPEAVRRLFTRTPANPTVGTLYAVANALGVEIHLVPGTKRVSR